MTQKPQRIIHFLGGLPRSGSTLLANILHQNPRFHATATSGVLSLLNMIRTGWERLSEFKAADQEDMRAKKLRVLRAALLAYFADVGRPVVFDKGRGWIGMVPFTEKVLGRKMKIIVPVRDVRDVLASFEKLNMRNALVPPAQELGNAAQFGTIDGRCQNWFAQNGMVGSCYRKLAEALTKGYRDRMFLVDYQELTSEPERVLRGLYLFLGESYFPHDFDHVEQVTSEDDEFWRMPGLHKIRQKVEPQDSSWQRILPPHVAKRYPGTQLWQQALDSQRARVDAALRKLADRPPGDGTKPGAKQRAEDREGGPPDAAPADEKVVAASGSSGTVPARKA